MQLAEGLAQLNLIAPQQQLVVLQRDDDNGNGAGGLAVVIEPFEAVHPLPPLETDVDQAGHGVVHVKAPFSQGRYPFLLARQEALERRGRADADSLQPVAILTILAQPLICFLASPGA